MYVRQCVGVSVRVNVPKGYIAAYIGDNFQNRLFVVKLLCLVILHAKTCSIERRKNMVLMIYPTGGLTNQCSDDAF